MRLQAFTASFNQTHPRCRCLPSDSCWPTNELWDALNTTVDGRLIKVVPIGAKCHDPHYDPEACEALQAQWMNPLLHIESPSSPMQLFFANQSCDPFTPRERPCELGNLVAYAVDASTADHIAATIQFAKQNNVRFVVRNTGHDFFGRSTGAGALAVWTHHMKSLEMLEFSSDTYTGKALRVGAGVQGSDIVEFGNRNNVLAVTGECPTVGVAGGFTQGGGHSPLSTQFGLAADQVLEYEVVTADGRVLAASPVENEDLYWALSGGGGGTYAVVVSMTIKAHEPAQIGGGRIQIGAASLSPEIFSQVIQEFHHALPQMVDNGSTVSYLLMGPAIIIGPITAYNHTGEYVQSVITESFVSALDTLNVTYTTEFTTLSYRDHYDRYYGPLPVGSVFSTAVQSGGRLVPRGSIESNGDYFSAMITNLISQQAIVVGSSGAYLAFNDTPNAVLPAWRNTLVQMQVSIPWSTDPELLDEMTAAQGFINDVLMAQVKEATPGGASYLNEASHREVDWKTAFFGENYSELERVKRAWDPDSIFYAFKGVGSETWDVDETGRMCRVES
ncbi:hypothetical protein B0I35DRAFT_499082 [Stachybotrys elegans]|uniref:FAD-binding PCMH-type domain-containing protein n=1 Tax=Stachybotrys elegans TaxID=80388 RepID=A0A8K0ST92_9HYPO|nr:hypothetical protein B0I35DRAFT_499082 [Stachybotrys elegans]